MPILDNYLPKTNFGPGIPDVGPTLIVSLVVILFFILEWSVLKRVKLFNKWTNFLALYSIIVFASVYWSAFGYGGNTLQILFTNIFMPLLVAIIAVNIFQDRDKIHLFIKHMLIAAFFLSLISMCQMVLGLLAGQEAIRTTGTFSKPNGFAMYLVMIIPLALYAVDNELISVTAGRVISIMLTGGILCTVSRKGIATMVFAFLVYNILKKRYRQVVFSLIGFVILAVTLAGFSTISGRFDSGKVDKEIKGKWALTVAGWDMFKSSPIIGLGFKGFKSKYGEYFRYSSKRNYDAHNIYITLLSDYGLIGFLSFMGVLIFPLMRARNILRQTDGNDHSGRGDPNKNGGDSIRNFAIIGIVVILPFMISGWFSGGLLFRQEILFLFFTNIAMLMGYSSRQQDADTISVPQGNLEK